MKTISVLEYCKNPEFHQVPGKTEVPKPTIFKQIKENRLPSNVRAVSIGGRYVMEVYEPGELCELVAPDSKQPGGFLVIAAGLRDFLENLAENLNKIYPKKPIQVRPV